jgi:hypothetical protein
VLQLGFRLGEYLLNDAICPELFDVGPATMEDLCSVMEILGIFSLSRFRDVLLSQQAGLPGAVDRHGELHVTTWGPTVHVGERYVIHGWDLIRFKCGRAEVFLEVFLDTSQRLEPQLQ